ncbi:MAG: hybrid sensor histidine kinase/response regulator [Microcoleus sp. PH2017_10_PVI_O_A]|uniref:hybrid sensor histidine kinase/response regulator n=1 Tax=unclassified Microcoleus TaxID=2642155 RepID=UPI001D737AA0|nr:MULTISPECIES: response regulator [unclassified Microcoleus]TAE81775.1 MAG: hybrid sensor histidine kinase/response regulator [Oscillatoriales cyanobacterium]MCC3406955.1 hybrid sensor histidine kinase/response regulator [Microcoleus sp. PH2017_10_PVI_O_A]MCC3461051.1 hybrid sensor histidine kinase/response regulator [Microcoleus sp. PH2017_11_PCY_U_A]MCC3479546.1 hybrid sensor histidine kinase/response regulator [Microcoleus sp. PH2017_12_PCY_D_A]MCC3526745.1 hybrid sensor histidine kinase/
MAKILTIADTVTWKVVQELLEKEGHQVKVASDGKDGFDMAREFSPDVIICDGTLPEIHWFEVCRLVKADRELSTGYFVLLTTPEQFAEVQKLDVPFDDFLLKPIVNQELLGRVRAGLRGRELRLELARTQQELQLSRDRSLESEKMSNLGELVSGIAHEINNPITFIYSNLTHVQSYATDLIELLRLYQKHLVNPDAEIMQKQQDMDVEFLLDDLLKIVSSMRTGSDRIRQIILSVQDFSRSDRSGWQLFDISDGLENTLLLLQHRLPARDGRRDIKVMKQYGNLPQVECYAGQLNQAFLNIINHAIDALEESSQELEESESVKFKPVILISTHVIDGQRIAIEIADNHLATNEDIADPISDSLLMAEPAERSSNLGLAISYRIIVEQHKGELKCFSEPGKGTKFRIEIPLRHS